MCNHWQTALPLENLKIPINTTPLSTVRSFAARRAWIGLSGIGAVSLCVSRSWLREVPQQPTHARQREQSRRQHVTVLTPSFQLVVSASFSAFAGHPSLMAIIGLPVSTVRRSNPGHQLIHTPLWRLLLVGPRDFIGLFRRCPGCVCGFATLSGPVMGCSQLLLVQGRLDFKATGHSAEDLRLTAIDDAQVSGVSRGHAVLG